MSKSDTVQRAKTVKTAMCPLKDQCPDDIRPRWPESGNKTTNQLGNRCPYAHHNYELVYPQQEKHRQKAMLAIKKSLLDRLEQDFQKPAWRPGSTLQDCYGCGKTFSKDIEKRVGGAGGIKGLCNFCDYKQRSQYMNKELMKHTKKKQPNKERYEEQKRMDGFIRQKLSLFRKAQTLSNKDRINEAFQVITQASQMVIQERIRQKRKARINNQKLLKTIESQGQTQQKTKQKPKQIKATVSTQVAINYFSDVIDRMTKKYFSFLKVYKKPNLDKYIKISQHVQEIFLKKKRNIFYTIEMYDRDEEQVEFKKPQIDQFYRDRQQGDVDALDSNVFMNYEIEKLYFKLKNKIDGIYQNIDFLQTKIESYDDEPKKLVTEFCNEGINCRDLQCQKAHRFNDFEFVDSYQAERNLTATIMNLEQKVKSDPSKPVWVPSGRFKEEYPKGVVDQRILECRLDEEELL